jgi:hypothetical protein
MLTCPMCKKAAPETSRECPSCRTDLSLLTDFVDNLRQGLQRADVHVREGRLGPAVWAYLEVLEIDPENTVAREQVGQVATAVRQFDRAARAQGWLRRLRRHARFRAWGRPSLYAVFFLAALALGYAVGYYAGKASAAAPVPLRVAAPLRKTRPIDRS